MKNLSRVISLLVLLAFLIACFLQADAISCSQRGKIKGRNSQTGKYRGKNATPGKCNRENDTDCCVDGKFYATDTCSPRVTDNTKATLTLNSFQKGRDGGSPSKYDHHYHDDDTPVVALSTGWYNGGSRCLIKIIISANDRNVEAIVVDECDSIMGWDDGHDYQPLCPNNIVDASKAVGKTLGVPKDNWGDLVITWSNA